VRRRAPFLLAAAGLLAAAVCACGGAPAPLPTPPPGAVVVTAQTNVFVSSPYTAPADAAFTLFLLKNDAEPHNARIWNAAGETVHPGAIVQGRSAKAEQVPALPAGVYRLTCDIHPDMTGQLNVQ
jgi:plastocyanin